MSHTSQQRKKESRKTKEKPSLQNDMDFKLRRVRIKIIGIGGGGTSIVADIARSLKGARFALVDCDRHLLKKSGKGAKIFLVGEEMTRGLGTGMDRELGQKIIEAEKEKINQIIKGADILILISSLGGGFGSGAVPLLAELARKTGAITLGIFTLPFEFEGNRKVQLAKDTLQQLENYLSGELVIPNDKIFNFVNKKTPFKKALSLLNERIVKLLKSLIETISKPGIINLDFSDLKTIFKGNGKLLYFRTVETSGPNRAEEAIKMLFQPSLYFQQVPFGNLQRILLNISGGSDLSLKEVELLGKKACSINPRSKIILGISEQPKYHGKLGVVFIGVGNHIKKRGALEETKKPKYPKKITKRLSPKKTIEKKAVSSHTKPDISAKKPKAKLRRNALEIEKEEKRMQEEQLLREKDWEIPAFLRKKVK